MHPAEIKVNTALHQCRELLTNAEYDEVNEFSEQHGEYGIAIETLAGILFEKRLCRMKTNSTQFTMLSRSWALTLADTLSYCEVLNELA